jgi:hypothetical protein
LKGIDTIANAPVTRSYTVYRELVNPFASAFDGIPGVPDIVMDVGVLHVALRSVGGIPEKVSAFEFILVKVTPVKNTPTVRSCVEG